MTDKSYQEWRTRADQAKATKKEREGTEARREWRKRWARERGLPEEWYDTD
jgi:hypothetical protein